VRIAREALLEPATTLFFFTSQTKPGPNMALAVARKVVRRDSGEEKDLVIWWARMDDISGGSGEMALKKKWLLWAMEAWLKREAWSADRAYLRRMFLVMLFSSGVPWKTCQTRLNRMICHTVHIRTGC